MIAGMKDAALALISHREASGKKTPASIATIMNLWWYWRRFMEFLVRRRVFAFRHATRKDVEEYMQQVRNGTPKTNRTIAQFLRALNYLHSLRDFYDDGLTDYLCFRATGKETAWGVAGITREELEAGRTKPIPDHDFGKLLVGADNWLNTKAQAVILCLTELGTYCAATRLEEIEPGKGRSVLYARFFEGRTDFKNANHLRIAFAMFRAVCFIVIAASTGMRISEILAIRRGCLRVQERKDMGQTFYFIDSLLQKTSSTVGGVPRGWMCGPFAAEAIGWLEKLGDAMSYWVETDLLFPSVKVKNGTQFAADGLEMTQTNVGEIIRRFTSSLGLTLHLTAHMFRRTFARSIVRSRENFPITALKNHFGHWSIYMTVWYLDTDMNFGYVNDDTELMQWMAIEEDQLTGENLLEVMNGPASGGGVRRLREYMGRVGVHTYEEALELFQELGLVLRFCSNTAICFYNPLEAVCGENGPNILRCSIACPNIVLTPRHRAVHLENQERYEKLYGKLNDNEKQSPLGAHYKHMINIHKRELAPLQEETVSGELNEKVELISE